MVKPVFGRKEWLLTDLLGRPMGMIRTTDSGHVHIEPDGKATATMTGMRCGPFASLDEALAMIETHTRGVCRREPGEAQAAAGEPAATVETSTDMSENASADPR
ncbi:hypothetical protein [Chenggangzhangella methanolivorans]|uniref:Uncharacterized protein n=1 Tax=Chenggangzhangella methanolivorans TaxID=1437009 RepID=A0A9E6R6T2_9HYPH|nr:hypothetical protein [Chenggangzhangella methanolivorans]QZN99290.1 hypothetical protein K6K41_21230 [Chenggangzhangella methanolivorans]